ncbi:MAG: xanthine dehydrogenase family protein molybdopterin-binding subunit [Planctomycetota bacterium]
MSRYEEVKIKLGFEGQLEEVTLVLDEGALAPYDLERPYSVVGKSVDRYDAIAKVTGAAVYTYDRRRPGLLQGRILRCPHANANVVSIDLEKAKAMPGVHAVIDLSGDGRSRAKRFAWDAVAAVAAETEQIAEEALRAIAVEYEVLPHAVRTRDAMGEEAPQVGRRGQANVVPMSVRQNRNESDEDFAKRLEGIERERAAEFATLMEQADIVIEEEFETQCQTHTSLETHGLVCEWDGDEIMCWASTQATFNVRGELMASLRPKNARVVGEYVGGGFGSKFSAGVEGIACARLARESGRPVKLMLDRREEHTSVGNRPDAIQKITMGLKKDGTVVGYRVRSWGTPGSGAAGSGARNDVMYRLGSVDKIEYAVRTNTGALRAMRAPGWPQGVYSLEQMMDIAAERIGMDPVEFRRRNDDHRVRPHEFKLGADRIGWKEKRRVKPGAGKGPVKSGVGCAGTEWFARGGGGAQCTVRVFKDGRVEIRNGSQDIGTGTRTIMGMICAEELGIEAARVATFIGDTDDPQGPGSGGSTTAPTLSPAARQSAHDAKRELLEAVAEAKKLPASELDLAGGQVVRSRGGSRQKVMSFDEACAMIPGDVIEVTSRRPRNIREGFAPTNAGAQFAEVEVDVETGEVRVKHVIAVADGGIILNAKTAESQVSGGVIQGVSYALFEDRVMDPIKGHMLNADMEAYKIAGPVDTPRIDVVLVGVSNGYNSTSCMGLGEPPVIATAAAIANAVYHAIGVRITSIPITPRKVLEALARKEKR